MFRISITTGIIYRINSQFVDTGVIRYDRTQTLSDSNKTLARENIDAANKNDVLPLTIDLSSQTVEDYNTALEAFNSKKPLTIFDSTDPTSRFTANVIEKETTTNNIYVYFSFTGINYDNAPNSIGYVGTIKPTGEKTLSFAVIVPSNTDPKPLGPLASSGTDNTYSRSDHVHPIQESVAKLTTPRTIALTGAVSGSTTFDGSSNVSINSTLANIDASKITSGTLNADRLPEIPISKIPAATSSVLGGVKIGSNITVSSGTISLSKANVTSALGYTPISSGLIPIALPNPQALTINGTSYTGSSAVSVTTPKILSTTTLSSSTVLAGYSYNNTASRTISSLSGFSASNPDSVIISTAKLTFTASNAIKMDGLAGLSGTYYIYCLSYMANGKIAVNGAVYA